MLSRAGAPRQAGAVLALVLVTAGTLLAAGGVAVELAALAASDERAGAAADAAAHAAEVALSGDEHLVDLSIAAQANRQACLVDPAAGADAGQEEDLCQPVLAAAREAATANGARLTYFRLGPALTDRLTTRGAGRLTTLVRVAVRRRTGPAGPGCPTTPPAAPSRCWAVAWSAAQLS